MVGNLFFSIEIDSTRHTVQIFGGCLPMSYSDTFLKCKRKDGGLVNAYEDAN